MRCANPWRAPKPYPVGIGHRSAAPGDLDADGDVNLVLCTSLAEGQGVEVLRNEGNETFTRLGMFGTGCLGGVELGDVDGDGDLDVVVTARNSSQLLVFLGDGAGNLAFRAASAIASPRRVELGDVDGDGELDAVVWEYAGYPVCGTKVSILLNDGFGSFAVDGVQDLPWRFNGWGTLGDVDGDGDLDVVSPTNASINDPRSMWVLTNSNQ